MADNIAKEQRNKIHGEVFKTLSSRTQELEGKMSEVRGELGAFVKNAEDQHGINRKAFKLVNQLDRMDQSKLADFLRSFDHYRELTGLDDKAGLDMFDSKSNVQPIRKAALDGGVSVAAH